MDFLGFHREQMLGRKPLKTQEPTRSIRAAWALISSGSVVRICLLFEGCELDDKPLSSAFSKCKAS